MEAEARMPDVAQPAAPEADSDAGWIAAAQAGDSRAFEVLYRRHVGRLYAVCLRLCGNRADAEEAVQDAFVKAWERLAAFRGEAAFGSWLHRIAVNCVLDRHRTRIRRSAWFSEVEDEVLERTVGIDSEPGTDRDLETAIASLPDGARHVFVLHLIEGHSHEEIAAMTGLAVGTCKAHVHRARKLLMRVLG